MSCNCKNNSGEYLNYLRILGETKVWIVGSSIIKNAFIEARNRPGGINLGLNRLGVSVWWQGLSGMSVYRLKQQIRTMMRLEDAPHFLILHIAGNDIGSRKIGYLRNDLKSILRWVTRVLPNTIIIWSQVLPRITWRYSSNLSAMEKCRYRINNTIASYILNNGGCYVRYPDIRANHTFLTADGVHLTEIGNSVFLNTLQGAIEHFMTYPNRRTFPF